ncbi:MAG: MarR family transcriptional regulator [Peptostreptococcaceae bacterium]|nr:MarR family transcriptional regulator [Peptostreptococcaceae bacterium]
MKRREINGKRLREVHEKLIMTDRDREVLFREYSVRCGLSLVASWCLYTVFYSKEELNQYSLAEKWNFPIQTVNFSVRKLVEMGFMRLEKMEGKRNSKKILLTEEGEILCKLLMEPLMAAELTALSKMSEDEREQYLALSQKHYDLLREEMENLYSDQKISFEAAKKKKWTS